MKITLCRLDKAVNIFVRRTATFRSDYYRKSLLMGLLQNISCCVGRTVHALVLRTGKFLVAALIVRRKLYTSNLD